MSYEEHVSIRDFYVDGLRTAVSVVRHNLDDSDSGYCKGGANSVGCSNCASNFNLTTGKDGYCLKESYDNSFQLSIDDATKIMHSKPALISIRCSFFLKAPESFLKAFSSFAGESIESNVYCRIDDVTGDSMFVTGTLWDVRQFVECYPEDEILRQFKKALSDEEFGWLVHGRC